MTTSVSTEATPSYERLAITDAERRARIERVRAELDARGLSGLVLFHSDRINYLSGFSHVSTERPMALVVPMQGDLGILIPFLEQEHVQKSRLIGHVKVYPEYPTGNSGKHPMRHLAELLRDLGLGGKRVGMDQDGYGDINGYIGPALTDAFPDATFQRASDIVDTMRQVKSPAEIALIRESCKWGNLAHKLLQKYMRVGATEIEVSLRATLDATVMMLDTLGPTYGSGGRGVRNPPCSASFIAGANSALPHGLRRESGLAPGDCIVTGASANVGGYRSELERTMIMGEPSQEFVDYFDKMLAIQEVGFRALQPGRTCAKAQAEIMRAEADYGVAHLTRHHTGHGIGLEGHEQPFIDLGDETVLKPGMVFSVEPGIYVPGLGGFRHSDTILITETGAELLTYYPRDLASLIVPV